MTATEMGFLASHREVARPGESAIASPLAWAGRLATGTAGSSTLFRE
jgi:hypothetical protein